jgi:hypothetical protein
VQDYLCAYKGGHDELGPCTVSRQKATGGDNARRELTAQQEAALGLFLAGRTVTETAEEIGVSRSAVSEWVNQNALFKAALNARRAEVWASAADGLRALLPQVIAAVAEALNGPDKLRAASLVLKSCGMVKMGPPAGSTSAEAIEADDAEVASENACRRDLHELGIFSG